jgi:hypothetical protein
LGDILNVTSIDPTNRSLGELSKQLTPDQTMLRRFIATLILGPWGVLLKWEGMLRSGGVPFLFSPYEHYFGDFHFS